MSAAHTPGPWHTGEQHAGRIDIRHRRIGLGGAINITLAEVIAPPGWLAEAEANARLFAAAPTMLATLQDALEYFEDRQDTDDGPDGEPSLNAEARMAIGLRAAIAKATGSQS